jgi:hypothetical protein
MVSVPYKIYVVVERKFGEQLMEIPEGVPVWIVDTPINKPVAERLRKERKNQSDLIGITTFNDCTSSSPEELLVDELDTIDLHHGPHSANPPYIELEVVGARLTDEIKAELSEYSFTQFEPTAEGFRCTRSVWTHRS